MVINIGFWGKKQTQYKNWYLNQLYLKLYTKASDSNKFYIYNLIAEFLSDFKNLYG